MPGLLVLGSYPGRIAETAGGQGAEAGGGLECEPEVRAAARAEFHIEPAAGFTVVVAIVRRCLAGQRHLIR